MQRNNIMHIIENYVLLAPILVHSYSCHVRDVEVFCIRDEKQGKLRLP